MLNKISDKLMMKKMPSKGVPSQKMPAMPKPAKPFSPKQKIPAMPMPGTTPRKFPGLQPQQKVLPKKKIMEDSFQKFRGQFKDKRLA